MWKQHLFTFIGAIAIVFILYSASCYGSWGVDESDDNAIEIIGGDIKGLDDILEYAENIDTIQKYSLSENVDNSKIIKKYIELLDSTNLEEINLMSLSKIIYINSVFDIEGYDYLIDYIDEYYDKETKVLCIYKIEEAADPVDMFKDNVATTLYVYELLSQAGVQLDKYEISEKVGNTYKKANQRKLTKIINECLE